MSKKPELVVPPKTRKIGPYYLVEERRVINKDRPLISYQLSAPNRVFRKQLAEGSVPEISIDVEDGVIIRKTRFWRGRLYARRYASEAFMIDRSCLVVIYQEDWEIKLYLITDGNETEKKLIESFWFDSIRKEGLSRKERDLYFT